MTNKGHQQLAAQISLDAAERRRQMHIVGAVLDVLCESGIAGLSMRKVAKRAGLHLGSLHYTFASKDEMLFATLEVITEQVRSTLLDAVAPAASMSEAIDTAQAVYWAHVTQTPALQRAQYELTIYAVAHPEAGVLAKQQYAQYLSAIAEVLETVLARSSERLTVSMESFARLILAGFDGVILQFLADGDESAGSVTLGLQAVHLKSFLES